MVPKIHAKGCSFMGIGKYVLFDKDRAKTSDRVAFTVTKNLATDDPHLACKLMAATSMDAGRLKAQAGVKNTGRRSNKSVLHVTLSWHPDQKDELTPEEMHRAARLAIRALGAEDRQALIVAHSDEDQPHLHLIINRTSPHTGKLLSSSNEKLRLSRFAERYERESGEILCEQRVINNAARGRKEYVPGEKDIPRHVYEQIRSNDNTMDRDQIKAVWERHRGRDREVGAKQRATRNRRARAWAELMQAHKTRRSEILERQRVDTREAHQQIQADYREHRWKPLYHEHRAETRAFERDEGRFLGRMKNRLRSVDLREMIGGEDRGGAIGRAFNALSSSGARREWLRCDQAKRERKLKAEQRREESEAAREIRGVTKDRLASARVAFQTERASLVLRCSLEDAKMRAEWRQRASDRRAAVERDHSPGSASPSKVSDLIDAFNEMRKNQQERSQQARNKDPGDRDR